MSARANGEPYHMRRSDRGLTDPVEIEDLLAEGRYATIAFARGDEPYLVTMSYGLDAEGRCLYFHAAKGGPEVRLHEGEPVGVRDGRRGPGL